MRIGIIGAGMIGSTLAKLWADAGHEVLVASRHPEELQGLIAGLGPHASPVQRRRLRLSDGSSC